ncbi:MAG: redox-sensing transcriptional repressor Rex [Planctomycetota bacterium]|nr:redox-sensing transcriptional repressor Rex [Planctomycetota bacterium]
MGRRERPLSSVIPRAAATRISLYLRYLEKLESLGETTTSSQQLGAALGVTAAQVRKDLGYFGQFGFPGVGYKISHLIPEIRKILGTDRSWSAALVGMGNLGSALFQYRGFQEQGFCFRALFDRDARLVGSRMGDLTVEDVADMPQAIARQSIELGVIAVPADAAQQVADRLVEAGVRGIFNFAPTVLTVPEEVGFVSVDLAIQLEQLSFEVTQLGGLRGRPGRTDVTNGKLTS